MINVCFWVYFQMLNLLKLLLVCTLVLIVGCSTIKEKCGETEDGYQYCVIGM